MCVSFELDFLAGYWFDLGSESLTSRDDGSFLFIGGLCKSGQFIGNARKGGEHVHVLSHLPRPQAI